MRATLGGLLLLKLVASRLTSCVNGPGWTPWADKPAKPARSPRKSQASANAPLDKFYIYDERDGPEFSLSTVRSLLGQASRDGNTPAWTTRG